MDWIKQNWFKLGLLVITGAFVVVLFTNKAVLSTNLKKDVSPTPPPVTNVKNDDSDKAEQVALQKKELQENIEKCAAQNVVFDKKHDTNDTSIFANSYSSSNHYNTKQRKCFIRMKVSSTGANYWSKSDLLYDGYEDKVIAGCASASASNFPSGCQVNGTSSSQTHFDSFINEAMTE